MSVFDLNSTSSKDLRWDPGRGSQIENLSVFLYNQNILSSESVQCVLFLKNIHFICLKMKGMQIILKYVCIFSRSYFHMYKNIM